MRRKKILSGFAVITVVMMLSAVLVSSAIARGPQDKIKKGNSNDPISMDDRKCLLLCEEIKIIKSIGIPNEPEIDSNPKTGNTLKGIFEG